MAGKVTATVQVDRFGAFDIDATTYTLTNVKSIKELYGIKDFQFKVCPYCWKVTESQLNAVSCALRGLGYEVIRG